MKVIIFLGILLSITVLSLLYQPVDYLILGFATGLGLSIIILLLFRWNKKYRNIGSE